MSTPVGLRAGRDDSGLLGGPRFERPNRMGADRQWGAGALEFLLAIPVMLLFGLIVWQWALVIQARQIVDYAVREGARSGALGNAEADAIEQGFALGLAPLWLSTRDLESRESMLAASLRMLDTATQGGWLRWRQLTPTQASFADWGVSQVSPANTGYSAGALEIPVDNALWRSRHGEPASGSQSGAAVERVGVASNQTFREAGILRIELSVGVPLVVPLAGRFISWAARSWQGCPTEDGPQFHPIRFASGGTTERAAALASGIAAADAGEPSSCTLFLGAAGRGQSEPRLPIAVTAEARMQSNARMTSRTPAASVARPGLVSSGPAPALPAVADTPSGSEQLTQRDSLTTDVAGTESQVSQDRRPGFLRMGAEREIWVPGACGMTPS